MRRTWAEKRENIVLKIKIKSFLHIFFKEKEIDLFGTRRNEREKKKKKEREDFFFRKKRKEEYI